MDLANNISNLGTVADASGDRVERIAKHWVPTKMAMKWNGRCGYCPALRRPRASALPDRAWPYTDNHAMSITGHLFITSQCYEHAQQALQHPLAL